MKLKKYFSGSGELDSVVYCSSLSDIVITQCSLTMFAAITESLVSYCCVFLSCSASVFCFFFLFPKQTSFMVYKKSQMQTQTDREVGALGRFGTGQFVYIYRLATH